MIDGTAVSSVSVVAWCGVLTRVCTATNTTQRRLIQTLISAVSQFAPRVVVERARHARTREHTTDLGTQAADCFE